MQVRGRGLQSGREAEEHSSKDGDGQCEVLIVGNAGGVGRSATASESDQRKDCDDACRN
jgi:hypothetical protein